MQRLQAVHAQPVWQRADAGGSSPENQVTEGLTFCSFRLPRRESGELRVKVASRASMTNRLVPLWFASCAAGPGAGAGSALRSACMHG